MSYTCVIVDDEALAIELIETYLKKLPHFEIVARCKNAIEASTILSNTKVDLLFLDIEMPILKGTDFFKNLVHKPHVIFTTAYRDYAVDGFELNAIDYLLKPIFFERFFMAIQKFLKQVETEKEPLTKVITTQNESDYIFVNKAKKQIKVHFDTILYIESLKDYIRINLTDDVLVIKESISAFEKRIDDRFIRTHRSYIANSNKITAYTKSDVEIGKFEIPIGESYKEKVIERLG